MWECCPFCMIEIQEKKQAKELLASYPGIHGEGRSDGQKECLVLAVCACMKISQKSGKLCNFCIMAAFSDSGNELSSALSYA